MIKKAEHFFARYNIWTNGYGIARTVIALSTFCTLLFNPTQILFIAYGQLGTKCDPFNISIFCVFPNLEIARWVAVALLVPVIIGWRPMITGIIHWYLCYSFINSATIIDGGDHIASIVTLLLIPVTLTDTRKWHWQSVEPSPDSLSYNVRSLIAISCLIVIKIQVAVIYLNSAVGKLFVPEWKDGTAIYYWFTHPLFGYPSWLSAILEPIVLNGTAIFLITWGTILFELVLFAGLFMDEKLKRPVLFLGIFFHLGIVLVHGLGSFFFVMAGALILLLYPIGRQSRIPEYIKTKIYDRFFSRRTGVVRDRADSPILEHQT